MPQSDNTVLELRKEQIKGAGMDGEEARRPRGTENYHNGIVDALSRSRCILMSLHAVVSSRLTRPVILSGADRTSALDFKYTSVQFAPTTFSWPSR